jgi:transcriptional regulator with XRE-family HTH domain
VENLIKAVRQKYDLTQQQMADETGISREYINKMEKGKLPISLKTEQLIRQAYAAGYVENSSHNGMASFGNVTLKEKDGKVASLAINELTIETIHALNLSNNRLLQEIQQQNEAAHLKHAAMLKKLAASIDKLLDINAVKLTQGKAKGAIGMKGKKAV